jgi:predicted ATPase
MRSLSRAVLIERRDNCEHVMGATSTLAEALLKAAPQAGILATSPEPLRAALLLDEKVSLIETTCISYFRPQYNQHYQNFPSREHRERRRRRADNVRHWS